MTSILVTGGTGSFGQEFVRTLLTLPELVDVTPFGSTRQQYVPGAGSRYDRIIVFSRDELKQHDMRANGFDDDRIRWFIGDVRDRDRLRRAMQGVEIVVHAAAMKQVPACEYNPIEAKRTNVDGAQNVIDAALDSGVERVLALGTDKAVDPVNLYGATKLVAEKLFIDANAYGGYGTKFSCTRYGNVISSRGSVLPLFQDQYARGEQLTVTDPNMTRFVLTLRKAVEFVLFALERMEGGEVFVPKPPAVTVATMAIAASWPDKPNVKTIGMRPAEKRHELLVSENELREEHPDFYIVGRGDRGPAVSSETTKRLSFRELRTLVGFQRTLEEAS